MASTRIWRSAVNKVTGNRLFSTLKSAAATVAVALAVSAGAQAPVTAPAAVPPANPVVKPVQKPLDKPLWSTLSRPQQAALEPLAGEWDRMEGVRKQKWLEIANRFASMKPDEQARVHERMREWVKLTPEQRRVARENYTLSKKIDATHKSEQWEKYQQLPEEQKRQLAAEAASARAKKVTNLPSQAQSNIKTVAPIKRPMPPVACAAGTVKNTAAAKPPCVPAPAAATPVIPPPAAAPAPVPNAK